MESRPDKVNILGVEYAINYVDRPSDVDMYGRESLWGQTDYWTRTIRIYDKGRPDEDFWRTILHEILHGIAVALHLKFGVPKNENTHRELDLVAGALADVLFRNEWLVIDKVKAKCSR